MGTIFKKVSKKLTIQSRWGEEKKVLRALDRILSQMPFQEEDCLELKTAVAEACLNAIEHGNLLKPLLPVAIKIELAGDIILVEVCDQGLGLNQGLFKETSQTKGNFTREELEDFRWLKQTDQNRGWGMLLIDKMVDEWNFFFHKKQHIFCLKMIKKMSLRGEIIGSSLRD